MIRVNYTRISKFILLALSLILIFLAYRASQLQFDYDFEKFFPANNEDLGFFKEYRQTFENDNDYILIALKNDKGIYDQDFLQRVEVLTDSLKKLPHLRTVISPLEMKHYELNPMGLGIVEKSFFHPQEAEKFEADSLKLIRSNLPIKEMVSLESRSLLILIKNIQMISKRKSDELSSALTEQLKHHHFDEVRTMGKIIGQKEYIQVLKKEFLTFMSISIFLLILLLIITYRSLWGVLIPLATVLLAVIGSLGFMQLSGTYLNMMTTLLPVIMLVVGTSDVVHLVSKYLEEIRLGKSKLEAIRLMVKKVGMATLLTSLTTALGFITLVGVSIKPIQTFGIFTAIGVVLAFVLSIFFIPAIFMLIKKPKVVNAKVVLSGWHRFLGTVFLQLCRQRGKVITVYVILAILSFYGVSKIKFDYFLMQDLNEEHRLMKDLRFFQSNYGGIRPFELAILPQPPYDIEDHEVLIEVEKLEAYLDSAYGVNQMIGPTAPYKFMNQLMRNNRSEYFVVPKNPGRFNYMNKQLQKFDDREEWRQIVSADGSMGRIYGRMVDPGSRAMLKRNENLRAFYQRSINSDIIDYRLTGSPVIVDQSGRYVAKSVSYGLLVAFGLIAISMGLLFRSVKMALLSLLPNIFPILFTAGFIGFAQINLNMFTAIVFTISFGIAVDDTIHFLSRYRQEMRNGRSRLYALRRTYISTGKAIIITTVILLGGFGSLIFSDFLSTFYIGLFVCMTLVLAVITDLTLLPLLLLGNRKNQSKTTV